MSDEAVATIATSDSGEFSGLPAAAPEGNEPSQESQAQPQPKQNSYVGPVDLSTLPDDIRGPVEGRINHLTKVMGNQERKFSKQLQDWQQLASDQSKRIEELANGMNSVVTHLETKSFADAETQLKTQMEEARKNNDSKTFFDLQDNLNKIRLEKMMADKQPKQQPQQTHQRPQPETGRVVEDAVQSALDSGDITTNDATYFKAWQTESDTSGAPLRPWANPADARFKEAFGEVQAVFNNQRYANLPFDKKWEEVDRRMGLQKSNGAQSVMGNGQGPNLTPSRKTGTIRLTPEQEKLAVRMKVGGSKAKTNADHIERYRQQLAKPKRGA